MTEPTSSGNNEPRRAAPGGSPGERLQAARIERGIAIQDLANQMHLSVSILESLEDNRFEDITAPIFVKGYLRSYARIVELDENEILEQYVSEYMEGDPPIGTTTSSSALSERRNGFWYWGLILLSIALGLGVWWYQRSLQTAEAISLDATAEPPVAVPSSLSEENRPNPAARLSSEAAQRLEQLPPVQAGQLPLQEERASLPSDPERTPDMVPELADTAEQEVLPQVAAVEENRTVVAPPPAAAGVVASSPQPEAAAQDDGRPLQLLVTDDTWADIRDASGRKLVYDLLRAGRRLALDAEPPLRLFFGNGRGVELRWKGQVVELENKIRADNTVRITLE